MRIIPANSVRETNRVWVCSSYFGRKGIVLAANEVVLTPDGHGKLIKELKHLTEKRRKEVAERIRDSIQFGELSENSEYDDAKNEQAFVEGRISQIMEILGNARVIEIKRVRTDRVAIGSTVILLDVASKEKNEYRIVGSAEADPSNNRISNESPVGRTIIGKKAGEVVRVEAPHGTFKYKVVDIRK